MLNKIKNILVDNGFEILLGICLAIIIIYSLYRKFQGLNGNWSKSYYTYSIKDIDNYKKDSFSQKKGPPKESKGELECKRVLEKIFQKPFNKIRPNFLNNPVTGGNYNLEIDCYNEEIGLGAEYSGIQQYRFTPFFHRNNDHFLTQKYRDELKKRMCKDNGVLLVEIPYTVKLQDIENFIIHQLRKNNFNI